MMFICSGIWRKFLQKKTASKHMIDELGSARNLFTVFLIAVAIVFFGVGIWKMVDTGRAKSWLCVDGVVLSSDVESHFIEPLSQEHTGMTFYDAAIRYNFTLNGQTYTNSHIIGNANRNDPSQAQRIVANYPPGAIVRIWYDPADPEKSMIDAKSSKKSYDCFLFGLLFVAFSGLSYRLGKNPGKSIAPSVPQKKTPVALPPKNTQVKPISVTPLPGNITDITGKWVLVYQVPSLREIISSGQNTRNSHVTDREAVMSAGLETLIVTITPNEIEFSYKDSSNQGGCNMVSEFNLTENRLDLVHKRMDFIIADVEGFPPKSYTYGRKEYKLTLISNEVEGLGNRRIIYHFLLADK